MKVKRNQRILSINNDFSFFIPEKRFCYFIFIRCIYVKMATVLLQLLRKNCDFFIIAKCNLYSVLLHTTHIKKGPFLIASLNLVPQGKGVVKLLPCVNVLLQGISSRTSVSFCSHDFVDFPWSFMLNILRKWLM